MAASSSRAEARIETWTPARMFAAAFGAVYLLVGLVGFLLTSEFIGASDDKLIIFHINGLHNVVHLAVGAVWLFASTRHEVAKMVNLVFGVVLLVLFAGGLTGMLDSLVNIKDAAEPDNYLHLASGVLAVYFGTKGAERVG